MLWIIDGDREYTWHIGNSLPRLSGRAIKFWADGDELTALILGLDPEYGPPIPGRRVIDPPKHVWSKAFKERFGTK